LGLSIKECLGQNQKYFICEHYKKMPGEAALQRKQQYFEKLIALLEEYPRILLVGADNVGSSHMQKIRASLRDQAVLLMGKNTMIRKAIQSQLENHPEWEPLLPLVRGNLGFVFTKAELSEVREKLLEQRVAAPAKAGAIAPNDVIVPAGDTGMEPTQTSFLQALNIASKINRGQVEIIAPVNLITKGQKVGSSEATLLQKLNIKPFSYGLSVEVIYDEGSVYDAAVLDITDGDILSHFSAGLANVASFSLASGFPTVAAIPHLLLNGYKNLLAVAVETEYTFPQAEKAKAYLENPEAFAASAAPASGGSSSAGAAEPEPEPEEEEEESEEEMGGGLFGAEDDW
jgi:large subunit ribosomal protein LP0